MRGAFRPWVPEPLFYPESEIVIITPPTTEEAPSAAEEPTLIHLAEKMGVLLATVTQAIERLDRLEARMENQEQVQRWNQEEISLVAREMFQSLTAVEQQIETFQQEETPAEEVLEEAEIAEIPALPPQVEMHQPEPEKAETARRPWFL